MATLQTETLIPYFVCKASTADPETGLLMGVRPSFDKPHPKCPLGKTIPCRECKKVEVKFKKGTVNRHWPQKDALLKEGE